MRAVIQSSFLEVSGEQWNGLLARQEHPTPFMDWRFLQALEASGCTTAESGWQPLPLTIHTAAGDLAGCTALYAKSHSYGEYVFDWAWAQAYENAGLNYFPKLLVASPFSPIPGSRLLAADTTSREFLIAAIVEQARESGLSSAHVLFADPQDLTALQEAGWLIRENVQFHWHNPGFANFDDYLASLTQPKRKKVKAERRKVREAGVETRMIAGEAIQPADWDFFSRCYRQTYREHGATPYLDAPFFRALAESMPHQLALCIASRGGRPIASSLLIHDNEVLYGRYWGALERVDCLHFEVAYYSPITWAIDRGLKRFEGGAQGEHKLARGFTPCRTYSAHWLSDPRFRDAVSRFLEREHAGVERYVDELESRSPLRASAS
jgi:predicted N-acyltransferase